MKRYRFGKPVWARGHVPLLAAVCLFALCSVAFSQSVAAAPNPRPQASKPTVVYEPGDVFLPGSRVYVLVGKSGLGHEHGVVGRLRKGRLLLDSPGDAGQLVFDIGTFVADADAARKYVGLSGTNDDATKKEVTDNMLGEAVLDASHFPTATFTIRKVSQVSQSSARGLPQVNLAGDFKLHGVTRPISVISEVEEQNGWFHLRGSFSMLQTEFGITPFSKFFGAVAVADRLTVWGDLWVAKERHVVQASGK